MIKFLISLSSIFILNSCIKNDENVVFINKQFKNELDKFIIENKEEQKIIFLDIADSKDIFEKSDDKTYLIFYCTVPNSCNGFYKSFKYKDKQILLYDFSDKIKFSDLLQIKKSDDDCNSELLYNDIVNSTLMKRYYFDENNKLIEIKNDGTSRIVD
nr:hypothetical protein [uncultured Flavobacterium sp.]